MQSEKHEFALYWDKLSKNHYQVGANVELRDADLHHRISRVLRLKKDDTLVLFDRLHNVKATFIDGAKKNVLNISILSFKKNTILFPRITFLLPLLKREAFEDAIYSCVELGVNSIKIITSQKTQRAWGGQKEKERLGKIMVAAAEQSKNFAIPNLREPQSVEAAIKNIDQHSTKLFFDIQGQKSFETIEMIKKNNAENIVLTIGPEGDFTIEEKQLLKKEFIFTTLTPTILRAQQAVVVSLGLIRSSL